MLARRVFDLHSNSNEIILLYKEDFDRAFRQLRTEPSSIPLQGFQWRSKYYFDLILAMGCRIAPYICQCTTDMVSYLHAQMGYFLLNYVDDLIGAEYRSRANAAHTALIALLRDIGILRSIKKSVAPTTIIDFIGNLFDTEAFTIGITPERKCELMLELECWRNKEHCRDVIWKCWWESCNL